MLPGLRIVVFPGLALLHLASPEAGERDLDVFLQAIGNNNGQEEVDGLLDLDLGDTSVLGDLIDNVLFGSCCPKLQHYAFFRFFQSWISCIFFFRCLDKALATKD